MLAFLRLPPPDDDDRDGWAQMLESPHVVHGTRPAGGAPPMLPSTVTALRAFYGPLLAELVSQLSGEEDAAEWAAWAEAT